MSYAKTGKTIESIQDWMLHVASYYVKLSILEGVAARRLGLNASTLRFYDYEMCSEAFHIRRIMLLQRLLLDLHILLSRESPSRLSVVNVYTYMVI